MTSPSFAHLDVRSFFSLKDGAFSPEDLARRAGHLGMPAVAMTDRDGLYGAARFVAACENEGIRPILGATLTLADGRDGSVAAQRRRGPERQRRDPSSEHAAPPGPQGQHVVLIATDEVGYANLCRLITDAHMAGERGNPSLEIEQILAHAEGLAAILGPCSPVGRLAVMGEGEQALHALGPWREAFGHRVFIGVEHRMERDSNAEIRALLRLADRSGLRAVATNPVRYLVREDAFLADALECMRKIVPLAPNNVTRTNAEGFLKPARAMRALFAERPELCDATLEIAEACTFDLGLGGIRFPDFPVTDGRDAEEVLQDRCLRGLDDRGVGRTREVEDRLVHELRMIGELGYAAYFLTVADICGDIRAMGIRAACRGSAASSLVTYALHISDVDAVRHDLVFERFLNPLRDELPDIDVDVESARREDVYDMVLSRYGDERAACVAMIDTYRARAAVREVGKMLGLPEPEVGVIAKAFPHIGARHLRKAIDALPELAGSNLNAGQLELLFTIAERLDGFPRHIALHPSGIVLSNDELVRRVPMERSFQGYRMIHADKDDVELLGYLKLDVLGVRMFSAMRHAQDELARVEHLKLDLDRIPTDDSATFELIRSSDTIGCFQIESPGQRELLQKFQPEKWEDLIIDISLFRPGPVKSDMVTPFLRRRHGMEAPDYPHEAMRPALRETYGVIVYHEQVMRVLAAIGGYSLSEADAVRRALGGDDTAVRRLRADFLQRAEARGIARTTAEPVWNHVAQFASFGFCKAHAAAFAVPTYQSAYLKAHHPAFLIAGLLTHDPGMYPRRLILEDAREHGITILPLDVNLSEPDYVVEVVGGLGGREVSRARCSDPFATARDLDDAVPRHSRPSSNDPSRYGIRLALKDVHGISDAEIRSISEVRAEKPFADVGDFTRRAQVSRPVTEAIAHAGGFDAIGGHEDESRRDRLFTAMTTEPQREGEQMALAIHQPVATSLRDYSDAERVRAELEVMGVDASRHIISFYEPLLADLNVVLAKDLHRHRSDEWVMVAGVKVSSQTPAVRSGKRIIFLTIDDATNPLEITVFERVQPWCARTVFHSFVVAVWGRLRRTGVRGVSVVAENVWDLTALHRARREGRLREALAEHGGPASQPRPVPSKLWHASPGSAGG